MGSDRHSSSRKHASEWSRTGDPYKSPTRKNIHGKIDDLNNGDFIPSNVNSIHQEALLYVFEDNEAVIKMIFKGEARQWDMFPEPTELLLIGYSIESNLDPKIQIKYIDTKNQLADILTKGNFTRDESNHLLCSFNISHFSSTNCSEVMSNRTQKRCRWRKSHSKVETDDEFSPRDAAKGLLTCLPLLHQKARGKPDMKVNFLWARGMGSIKEQGDLLKTLTHQATQSGMLTRIGLLKSGNLMKCWK